MNGVDVFYINLARATQRRQAIEQSYADSRFSSSWRLNRFEAIDASSDEVRHRQGPVINALKANWLSHMGCAKSALARGLTSHILIAEDDTEFSPVTEYWVNGILNNVDPTQWDVLYLDAFITNAVDMPWFFKARAKCFRETSVGILPLFKFPRDFAGAGSYIVNNSQLRRFVEMCDLGFIPIAFDLYLRKLVTDGFLKGFMTYPFLTTVAKTGDLSQVQYAEERVTQDVVINAFRRLVWMGAGPPNEELAPGETIITKDVQAFQGIFSKLLTMQLGWL